MLPSTWPCTIACTSGEVVSTRRGSTFPVVVARQKSTSNWLNPFSAEAASPVKSGILVNTIPSFGSDRSSTPAAVGLGDGVCTTGVGDADTLGGFCPPEEHPASKPISIAPTTNRATTRLIRAPLTSLEQDVTHCLTRSPGIPCGHRGVDPTSARATRAGGAVVVGAGWVAVTSVLDGLFGDGFAVAGPREHRDQQGLGVRTFVPTLGMHRGDLHEDEPVPTHPPGVATAREVSGSLTLSLDRRRVRLSSQGLQHLLLVPAPTAQSNRRRGDHDDAVAIPWRH